MSFIPLGFFNYGGMMAIQTLWAGPWMLNVSGYNAFQSASGLFVINITYSSIDLTKLTDLRCCDVPHFFLEGAHRLITKYSDG